MYICANSAGSRAPPNYPYPRHRLSHLQLRQTRHFRQQLHSLSLLEILLCRMKLLGSLSFPKPSRPSSLSCPQHGRHHYTTLVCGVPHHRTLQSWCLELSHGPDIVDGSIPRCLLSITDESCVTPSQTLASLSLQTCGTTHKIIMFSKIF